MDRSIINNRSKTEGLPSKERLLIWDNIKGILIFLVLLGHCLYGLNFSYLNKMLLEGIYFFHMPAFIFVSGYFGTREKAHSPAAILRLFFAYLICILPFVVRAILRSEEFSFFTPVYSSWYLLALIVWRLITPTLARQKWMLTLALFISVISGYEADFGGVLVLALSRVIAFYPFYLSGYLFRKNKEDSFWEKQNQTSKRERALLALLGAVAIICVAERWMGVSLPNLMGNQFTRLIMDPAIRIAMTVVSFLMVFALIILVPSKKIPIFTKMGRNSLSIYLFHRIFTVWFYDTPQIIGLGSHWQILLSLLVSLILGLTLGSDMLGKTVGHFLDSLASSLDTRTYEESQNVKCYRFIGVGLFLFVVLLPLGVKGAQYLINDQTAEQEAVETPFYVHSETQRSVMGKPIYRVMSEQEAESFQSAFKILFAGDMILLEDQVRNAYKGNGYDFTECFTYTQQYISAADYAIAVLEGPLAGEAAGYSTSNYGDGKELRLSFPDAWARAIQEAGFDLVTTSNNHILDKGTDAVDRTIRVLREIGLDYIGSYESPESKKQSRVKIVETDGIRLAILAYSYGTNYYSTEALVEGGDGYVSTWLLPSNSNQYDKVFEEVKTDFETAQKASADLIIVLPHWGEQFADYPNEYQLHWEEIFKQLGADIILGDHTHSVQPVYMEQREGKKTYTLYCPGNYANIFREYKGDFSAMTEVYIDRNSKQVIGGSVIPMWTESAYTGNYRPLPLYQILTDENLGKEISTYDLERVAEAQSHIAQVMLGESMDIRFVQERLYFDERGFMRTACDPLVFTENMQDGEAWRILKGAQNVCFVGDSITEGSANGGVGWYEPLRDLVSGKIYSCAWGSTTVKLLLKDHLEEICRADADLFVIAVGTNDVRYRDAERCAMTAEEYIGALSQLKAAILEARPQAQFLFIAPWTSCDGDISSNLDYPSKRAMNQAYTEALRKMCRENGDGFVDPNPYIDSVILKYPQFDYLLDAIHPDNRAGVCLYAEAVLLYREEQ